MPIEIPPPSKFWPGRAAEEKHRVRGSEKGVKSSIMDMTDE